MTLLETQARRHPRLSLLVSFVLIVFVYSASLPKDFTNWDDPKYILSNPLIQTLSFQSLYDIFATPYFANYAPVTMVSYAVDLGFWGPDANAFHVHNVLLHAAALVSLYLLLGQLGLGGWPRWLAVLAFAVHPTNVETVSWASERKNLLSSLFFLLCFSQYVAYARRRDRTSYLLSLLFFALSLLSKAGTVLTPLIFLAFDYFWEQKKARDIRYAEKIPFFLLAAAGIFLSIFAAGAGGSLHSYYDSPLWVRILDSGRLIAEYLKLLLWPVSLTPLITPRILPSPFDPSVLVPFLVVVVLLALAIRQMGRSFFWIAMFLLLLAPVINIVPLPVAMACRYLYLPQIGIWVLLGSLLQKWDTRIPRSWRYGLYVAFLMWAGFLTLQARSWAADWKDSISLWESATRQDPKNLVARANLGQAYLEQQRNREASREFRAVLEVQPDNVLALTGMAACSLAAGDFEIAESYALQATRSSPEYPLGHRMLGRARLLQKDPTNAREALVRAFELNPSDNDTLDDLVSLYQFSSQPLDGTFFADLMIRNSPHTSEGYWARARLLLTGQLYSEAVPFLEAAAARRAQNGYPPDSSILEALTVAKAKAQTDRN